MIKLIEQNAIGHFAYLPQQAGFPVKQQNGLTIINCGMRSSMFNIVCGVPQETMGTNVSDIDIKARISSVIHQYKGQPFAWWVLKPEVSDAFRHGVKEAGFIIETSEYAMICDLDSQDFKVNSLSGLNIFKVSNHKELNDFIEVLEPYDNTVRAFYEKLELLMLEGQESLFVGYEDNVPVTIGILYKQGNAVGLFSLLTDENKRGKGFGTQMMQYLLKIAKDQGAKFATLSASSDSGFRIYERLGFKSLGEFECFEFKGIGD